MRARFAFALLAAACVEQEAGSPAPAPRTGRDRAPLLAPAPTPAPPGAALGMVVLDVDGDRALVGELPPLRPGTDSTTRLMVRYVERDVAIEWPLSARPLAYARFMPGRRVVAVTAGGELLDVDLASAKAALLDAQVFGSVGASPDGRHLVYCKGEPPELEVWRHDGRGARPVTGDMAPTWSPAVSPDGRTVVFVSARSGVPALWRTDDGGAPRAITNRDVRVIPGRAPELEPFPDALGATLLAGGRIVFETRGAVHVISDEGRLLRSLPDATAPHWIEPGRTLGVIAISSRERRTIDLDEAR
ncbi:MAG: hypothetical protein AABZ30_08840 [Myxococcota bacterium]